MAVGWFYLSVLALCSLGSMCILFTIYWMRYWHGGFAWDGSILMFNWHPVLMVTGMVVLYSAASLVYRLPQSWVGPRLPWKSGHAAMHLLAFLLTVLGLHAVFEFHNHAKIPNLYSLHSWLGITTVFLFACQWFLGFSVFLLPWASMWLRSLLKPIHVFFGASILSLAIASVISGINEKLFFRKMAPSHTPTCPVRLSLPTALGCWWWSSGCWCSISYWHHLGNAQNQGCRPRERPCCMAGSEAGSGSQEQLVCSLDSFPKLCSRWLRARLPLPLGGPVFPQPAAHVLSSVALASLPLLGIDFSGPPLTPGLLALAAHTTTARMSRFASPHMPEDVVGNPEDSDKLGNECHPYCEEWGSQGFPWLSPEV